MDSSKEHISYVLSHLQEFVKLFYFLSYRPLDSVIALSHLNVSKSVPFWSIVQVMFYLLVANVVFSTHCIEVSIFWRSLPTCLNIIRSDRRLFVIFNNLFEVIPKSLLYVYIEIMRSIILQCKMAAPLRYDT